MIWGHIKKAAKPITVGVLGMSAAGTLSLGVLIGPWEGRTNIAYLDKIAVPPVWTVCGGITGPEVIPNKFYSNAECDQLEAERINLHEARVDSCLTVQPPLETKAAFISFDFNTGRFCRSTLGRKAAAGDFHGACNELSRWVYAGKKRIRGLENRRYKGSATRISERTLCRIGLDPSYKTPLYERVHAKYKDWRTSWSSTSLQGASYSY